MRNRYCGVAAAVAFWMSGPLVAAQTANDLPSVTTLSCGKGCTAATEPSALEGHLTDFPSFTPDKFPTEGLVVMRATVTKDGHLQDRKIVRLIGAQIFADKVMEASEDWRYQPATRNGVAVDRPNWEIRVTFLFQPPVSGAREEVYRAFREAHDLSQEGKHSEAIAMLVPVLSKPHLNFYERSVVSLQLAIDYVHVGDNLTAREYLDDLGLVGDQHLPAGERPAFWYMAVIANAKTGQLREAKAAFEKMKTLKTVTPDDPLAKVIAVLDERIANPKPLLAFGRIPKVGAWPSWRHDLLRHNLAIVNVVGRLDGVAFGCGDRMLESRFSDKAEWHIPPGWKDCDLSVDGEPGTTFTLVETDD